MNTMAGKGNPNTRSGIVQGFISAWPICLGYIPVGLALRIPGAPYQSGLPQIRLSAQKIEGEHYRSPCFILVAWVGFEPTIS
jgi:hypothetical protein